MTSMVNGDTPRYYLIEEAVVRGVLDYLIQRPYKEVVEGVVALQSLTPAPAEILGVVPEVPSPTPPSGGSEEEEEHAEVP